MGPLPTALKGERRKPKSNILQGPQKTPFLLRGFAHAKLSHVRGLQNHEGAVNKLGRFTRVAAGNLAQKVWLSREKN